MTATQVHETVAQDPPAQVVEQAIEQELRLEEVQPKSYVFAQSNLANFLSRIWPNWRRMSLDRLVEAEKRLLAKVESFIISKYVNVRLSNSKMYTLTAKANKEEDDHSIPFVLVHGFAAGVAIWKSNIDSLAQKRTVHAFDLLGFGRSSRPKFENDATLAELEFVQSIEDWRKSMGIEKMILVGHSFGGFLASSYTLEHPSRVRHLVLIDPWGFSIKPHTSQLQIPLWMKAVGAVLSRFNALSALRLAGPLGPFLVQKLRADLGVRYSLEDPTAIYDYIYQCNAQQPTGEEAFRTMTRSFGWPKRPMILRFSGIDQQIPVTFVCGSKSWINTEPFYEIQSTRKSYVDVKVVESAGHHVYVDQAETFNKILSEIHEIIDKEIDLNTTTKPTDEEANGALTLY
ncbi:Abhydrolase domain-containing protein 4 [Aphelenchoides bicaudatus]|nr:Abhydrolase domain-containing protein 4 [Aphelenchoides bicaudatus]